ncbi:MAG: glycosyltransferase, partial [Pseudomonadota bacterium]
AFPEAVLILVPRHPGRFDDVAGVLERAGHRFVRRTDEQPASADTHIVLGDTMGEVPKFYAASDVAFVGGSLVRVGGHNLLEPAALSKPIITGPHLFNAQDISQKFKDSGSVVVVEDAPSLARTVIGLLRDAELRDNMGERALQLISENRGAVDRLLTRLEPVIGGGTFSISLQG